MNIIDLGLIDYQEAYQRQKQGVEQVIQSGREQLFLCEHPAVLTLGRLAEKDHIICPAGELEKKQIKVLEIDRGGEVTLHAPGQLIVYPILNLKQRGRDLNLYIRKLEAVSIDFLKEYGISSSVIPGKTGIWVGNKKIVSIGIGVKKWVTFHGIGLNINTDLELFKLIRPCGLDVGMTSVKDLTGKSVDIKTAKKTLGQIFQEHFKALEAGNLQQKSGLKGL